MTDETVYGLCATQRHKEIRGIFNGGIGPIIETFSALLAICAGNSPVPGECPAQRLVAQSFDVFFDLRLNKRLSK